MPYSCRILGSDVVKEYLRDPHTSQRDVTRHVRVSRVYRDYVSVA